MEKEKVLPPLSDNGKRVLAFLQENDSEWVGSDLAEATGVKGVFPVLNSLIKRGLVVKGAGLVRPFTGKDGETSDHSYKTYLLTEAGRDYIVE